MRNAMLVALLLVTLSVVSARAQEGDYRLRVPSVADFLAAIPEALSGMRHMRHAVLDAELATHYPDAGWLDFALVESAYQTAWVARDNYSHPDANVWTPIRVISWLTSNDIALHEGTLAAFDSGEIHVRAVDLDGDGQDEWALNYISRSVDVMLFLRRNADGRYTPIPHPIPAEYDLERISYQPSIMSPHSQIIGLADFTQDGLDDVALVHTSLLNGRVFEQPFILTLREGVLVDVADQALSVWHQHQPSDWLVFNLDQDDAMEIQRTREAHDNWHCQYTKTSILDWQESGFTAIDENITYSQTAPCYARFAEEALWAGDFEEAIDHYHTYLELEENPTQYAEFRLGIALVMSGQTEQGIARLRQLQTEQLGQTEFTLLSLVNQVLEAYADQPTPFAVCLAAHEYFVLDPYAAWDAEYLEVGFTIDDLVYGPYEHVPDLPSASQAGCDVPLYLNRMLANMTFTTQVSPLDQLKGTDIMVGTSYQTDLNHDGIQDWLVWLPTTGVWPLFFLSDGETYTVSNSGVSPYPLGVQHTVETVHLPTGLALLSLDYSARPDTIPPNAIYGGIPGDCPADGYISLWQLADSELEQVFRGLLCDVVTSAQIADAIDNTRQFRAWRYSDIVEDYVPVTYVWEATSRSFVMSLADQMVLTPTPRSPLPVYYTYHPLPLYLQEDYDSLIAYHDAAVQGIRAPSDVNLLEWRYFAALALEALNRPDEALAEYFAIYEAAPESAWGMLAALHFESE